MRNAPAAVLALLALAPAGAASTDRMLCFHRDGHVAVEPFQELCCTSPCAEDGGPCPTERPPDCPDDPCRDVPLTVGPDVAPPASPGPSAVAPAEGSLPADLPAFVPVSTSEAPPPVARALGPPGPPLLAHLRTVVLRP